MKADKGASGNSVMGSDWRILDLISCLGVAMLLAGGLLVSAEVLEYRRSALLGGELWRLWSAHFCHWSNLHAAANWMALGAVWVIMGERAVRWFRDVLVVAPLLSGLLLLTVPALESYRGLSGLIAFLMLGLAIDGGVAGRWLFFGWLVQFVWACFSGFASPVLPSGIDTCWQAHLAGLALGVSRSLGRFIPGRKQHLAGKLSFFARKPL